MRRSFWILLTPAIFLLLMGFLFDRFLAPSILQLVVQRIQSVTKKQGPFEIKIQDIEFTYLPIGIKFTGISLKPKKNLEPMLSTIEIERAQIELAVFALLTGKLKIGTVLIESPSVQITTKFESEKSEKADLNFDLNWKPYLDALEVIPLEQVNVKNLNLILLDSKSRKSVALSPVEIQFLKLPDLFQMKLSAPQITTSWDKQNMIQTRLNFSAVITPENLRIQNLDLQNPSLQFNLSGQIKAPTKKGKPFQTQVHWKGQIYLDEFKKGFELIFPETQLPNLGGNLKAQGTWQPQTTDWMQSTFQIQTENVKIAQFDIGDAEINGNLKKSTISFDKIKAEHPAGQLELEKTELQLNSALNLQSQVKIQNLDFQDLFLSLNLKGVPVEGKASGTAPCLGQLNPIEFNCDYTVLLQDLQVKSGMKKEDLEIVALERAKGSGKLKVNYEQLTYLAEIEMPKSKIESKGKIDFSEGFQINYAARPLAWSDVKNLANLKLEGVSEITGTTSGNSSTAVFALKMKSQKQKMSDYYLGDTEIDLNYLQGTLFIPRIQSTFDTSLMTGKLEVDLKESTIKGQLNSEKMGLEHIREILMGAIPIPVSMRGPGKIGLQFQGPLDFWKLNTRLVAEFQQPQVAGEILNSLKVQVESQKGNFVIQQAEAFRNQSTFNLTGQISSEKELNLQGLLKNARLEESDNVSAIGWPLSGDLNAQMKISGQLSDVNFEMSGQVAQMILNENEVANSSFRFQVANSIATLEGIFFGKQVQTFLQWPLGQKIQPLSLRFKSEGWDYAPWLSLFNAGAVNEETRGLLSTDMNLKSETGDWNQLSGLIKLNELSLTRQGLTLKNQIPILVRADSGKISTENFTLKDEGGGSLEIKSQSSSLEALSLELKAMTDLKLLQIFIPTFEEISGPLKINAQLTGPLRQPNLLGQMSVRSGYFKIKNFPHAFEKMNVDSTFSQSRVLINRIQGELGGGELKGEGSLQIQGPLDLPLYVRVKAQDVSLNIPNGVKTKGDIDLNFTGRKFPYLLTAQYRVKSTFVEMNFGSDAASQSSKQNFYLPTKLKEATAEPIELDLQLMFERPIQVKNNLMEAQVTGNLAIKGSPSNPIILGQLKSLKGSQIYFKDKPFSVQTANIQFLNQTEINPELFISAQTRVDTYDVSLLVQGSAKEPTIRLSSQPPLSDNDLTSLLALGVTTSKLETVESKYQQEQTVNEAFAAAFQSTGLSKKVQSATGFNVQLSNTFDTTRNISVPKFTVSRKLNKNTNASVAFPVTGDQKTPEGKIQYSLTDNFSVNGSYEARKFGESTTDAELREIPSILGLDLEYSQEFK
jgi:translocation and assembly module TamB